MRYWLVLPAAGSARRFGGGKQYAELGHRSVLELALAPFAADPHCAGGCIVVSEAEPLPAPIAQRLAAQFVPVSGGVQRVDSVRNGLLGLAAQALESDWVLVHDAARPCLSAADLARLLAAAADEPVGALLASRVVDTVKRVADAQAREPRSAGTEARETLWLAQTPQMCRYGMLRNALARAVAAGRVPTDEAQALEWLGLSPRLVEAVDENPKITHAADLRRAAMILEARARRQA